MRVAVESEGGSARGRGELGQRRVDALWVCVCVLATVKCELEQLQRVQR